MTDDQSENMHALLLRFLGSFAHLQDVMDNLVARRYLDKRMPAASEFFWNRAVKRIRDDERITLFLAIAQDVESDADLTSFKSVFNRVKALRDSTAHSSRIVLDDAGVLTVDKSMITQHGAPPQRTTVERDQVLTAIRECDWLEAQAHYVASSGQLYQEIRLGTVLMSVLKPTADPADWDGTFYQGVDG